MEIDGEHRFAASRDALWEALFDPVALRAALPAIESLEPIDEETWELIAFIEVRGFWGRFRGLARVSHAVTRESYHLRLSGAAAEGTAMGQGTITLLDAEDGAGAILRYRGDLTVHGALTRLGGRFIGGAVRLLLRQLFEGLARGLAGETDGADGDAPGRA